MTTTTTPPSHFETLQQFSADYAPTKLTQYKSTRTGMQVVVVDRKGPKVQGYFTLATEIFDDSGAPHTLEHLVFMGSKSYKYKGVLDLLANRAYSNTNAWTATDHTAYTLDTAGWEGFAQILPVYLEHVIVPTLTDEGCYTEVHHVDGDGNDAGVVYSEMQGVQNNGAELMDLAARRALYPEGVGFRYETGGMMEQLRVLTAERIRAFHREMYQPKNLCLVIVGEVEHENMLAILDEFEEGILGDIPKPDAPFQRPWIESPETPALKETVLQTVEFPEEDESAGDILVGFLGPDCNDVVQTGALNVLLTYLSGSSISILENTMVEKEELASSISTWWDARPNSVIWLQPTSVATEKLAEVEKRLFEVLKEVAAKPLDMKYMVDCVRRERRQVMFQAESNSEFFSTNVINDFLFGKRDGSTLRDLASIREYDVLEKWTDEEWRAFLRRWISDAKHVSILGKPSKAMSDKLKADEVARVAAQKEVLGVDGLKALAKKLEDAKAKNDAPIPQEILEQWPVPGVSSIHFIETETARAGLARSLGLQDVPAQKVIDKAKDTSLFLQFEHVPSNFVLVSVLLGTSGIPVELRPLLPLFIDNFFNTPVMQDGVKIPFETVVTDLEKDTISYSIGGGSRLGYSEGVGIVFEVEMDKYERTIHWIRTMMFDAVFDVTRLRAALAKIMADIPEAKRSGNSMAYAVDAMLHLDSKSTVKARNTLVKAVYLKRIRKLLDSDPAAVIAKLEALRAGLFTASNVRLLVVTDVTKLPNPTAPWAHLTSALGLADSLTPIEYQHQRLSAAGRTPGSLGTIIVPMPTIDSSFAIASAPGPTSYTDPRIPALLVAVAYLDAVEGPLWRAVRGTGLAYGTSFSRDVDGGFMQFRVYRSPDAHKAFARSRDVVAAFASGKEALERSLLEGAVSAIVVSLADEQATMAMAAQMNFVNGVVRGVEEGYNEELLRKVRAVGEEEVRKVMGEVLVRCFEPGRANVVVTCAPVVAEAIVKGFEADGFKTEVRALGDFKDDYGLVGDDDEGEDDDEDEEGESGDESGSGEESE
ncbi:hypothetical protein VE03_00157 [Pseudogymnoascus sp. 23342-1-I1]|nr:hypothetical protein VE03_00157 [Pseudogymnoascus sp. 23342-1-I1]